MLLLLAFLLFISSLSPCHPTETTSPSPPQLNVSLSPQDFSVRPSSVEVKEGESVTLPCVVQNKRGEVQWTKDGFGLGNLDGFDRYTMAVNESQGAYNLTINPVQLDDNANFECQVGAANDTEAIRSGEASLEVLVAPEPPVIINGGELRTTEGTSVDLECISRGGKPAAEITWVDGNGNSKTSGVESSEKEVEGTKLVTVVSKLALTAAKDDHNTTLTCRAEHGAESTSKNDSIRLLVEYTPQVQLDQEPGEGELHEGDDVVFNCSAHANPSHISFRWFKDGNIVAGNHGKELKLESIDRVLHQKSVTCEASNDIGTSESSSTIEMTYPPKFTQKPVDVSGEFGQEVQLTCEVDSNPAPEYTWFRNGDLKTVRGHEGTLPVRLSPATVGRYMCRASSVGFNEISAVASVFMKGPPKIIRRRQVQYGEVGDTVRLVCDAFAIPPPDTATWTLNGQELPPAEEDGGGAKRFEKEEDNSQEDGITSTLVIRNITRKDMVQNYNCTVGNEFGQDSVLIELREQSLPVLAILGIIVGAVFAILLMAQAFMVAQKKLKRRNKIKSSYRRTSLTQSSSSAEGGRLDHSGETFSTSPSSDSDSSDDYSDSSLSSMSVSWTVGPSEDSYVQPMFHSSSAATLV